MSPSNRKKTELKITGFGGQGVILSTLIIGKAASIFDNQYATMIQSFGPEARGGACNAQLIISDEPIMYPYVVQPDILVVMSQEAYTRFAPELNPDGLLIYEESLVTLDDQVTVPKERQFKIPATKLAEELGRKIVLNIVMVGFFTAVSKLIGLKAMRKAVESSVPHGTETLNIHAFNKGYKFGKALLKEKDLTVA
jgi:2-oxoglutarate ferredoxin oxidoreductase subunit gamma